MLAAMDYKGVAYEVMRLLLTDYTDEELKACIESAYDSKFDTDEIVPLKKSGDAWYLELFHGPTIAFKDMALSILPYLMTTAAAKNGSGKEIVILTATSGDTGKAALAGFAGVKSDERRHRQGCARGLCGRQGNKDHGLLSQERRILHSGETDGDDCRSQYKSHRY